MSSRVDIVNYALVLLGESPLTSAQLQSGSSDKALTMSSLYVIAKNATLEAHEWSFAIKRFEPAKNTTEPVWGWAYAYDLPSDILRLLRVDRDTTGGLAVQGDDMRRDQVAHELEGRKILCNQDPIYCTGIRAVEDEGIFSPMFSEAFAAKLAWHASIPITESNAKKDRMAALFIDALNRAKSRDGMQSSTRRLRSHWLRRARGSRGYL